MIETIKILIEQLEKDIYYVTSSHSVEILQKEIERLKSALVEAKNTDSNKI